MIYEIDNNFIDLRSINAISKIHYIAEHKISENYTSPKCWHFGIYLPHMEIFVHDYSSSEELERKRVGLIEAWKIAQGK